MLARAPPAPPLRRPRPALGDFGIDLTNRDEAVKPGDDFFKYANGKWLATFQIPADKARYGSFERSATSPRTT